MSFAPRNADRAGGPQRDPAHRRRAERLLSAARPVAEEPEPFCLFLDELPACTPDIQKSFYSLLLERRLGEWPLPEGTWVVAAGNRAEDRSLVRSLSAALVNRVVYCYNGEMLDETQLLRLQGMGIWIDVDYDEFGWPSLEELLEDMEAQDLRRAAERKGERRHWSRIYYNKHFTGWGTNRMNKKYFDCRVPSGRGATSVGRGRARCF